MGGKHLGTEAESGFGSLKDGYQILTTIKRQIQNKVNLADIVWDLENVGKISKEQIPALVYSLLREDLHYSCRSFNMGAAVPDWKDIYRSVKDWYMFDTVLAYYDPRVTVSLINPSRRGHWQKTGNFLPHELVVVYTKSKSRSLQHVEKEYLDDFKVACIGKPGSESSKPSTDLDSRMQSLHITSKGRHVRITPRYSVLVTNGLFHHGNVEAWRNILESYHSKHPRSTVQIFHDGERINNISSLFKWGKVKVGDAIYFSVVGEKIEDVAKLHKYLSMGASPRFMAFIKKNVNLSLNLF
ncbi:MAG: hypothetical protein GY866_02525 [Proteobacteria bacterium]|nr:hypothetical protein [Pseudomonadota bacterium]